MTLYDEMTEQADVLQRAYTANLPLVREIGRAIPRAQFHHVLIAARGTSDNAARYANYLWGVHNRLPVTLAAPSLFSVYQQPPDLGGALVVGISQSGQSPDIVAVLVEARRQGRPTVAITNEPASPLAQTADFVIETRAGEERAVAATKTYTTQLLAIALLSAVWEDNPARLDTLARLPAWVGEMLAGGEQMAEIAERYRTMTRCVVLGRGFNYATAFEWSLKLKELSYVLAEPYSPADFQHGPIAMVQPGFSVLAAAPAGKVLPEIKALLQRLTDEIQAELLILTNDRDLLQRSESAIALPGDLPEWISPLVTIIPAQLFTYALTRAKGYDTENPRGLNKVTLTR